MERYNLTLRSEVNWPSYLNPRARSFLEKLIVFDPSQRMAAKEFREDPLFIVITNI